MVLAKPAVTENPIAPESAATARQVPISPYRCRNVGLVDVGYYTERRVLDETIPDVLLYLSLDEGEDAVRERVERQGD